MTTMTFDKLAYIDRLKAVGFTDSQARAIGGGLCSESAVKRDIEEFRAAMRANKIDLMQWLAILFAVQTIALLALKYFVH